MRIVVELRRGEQRVILNNLYKQTQMQTSFGVIMLAIVNGQPRVLRLDETPLLCRASSRRCSATNSARAEKKAEERAHILEGLKKALDKIDAIIKLIRACRVPQEARQSLMKQFNSLRSKPKRSSMMQLQRLTSMEREKLMEEYEGA